MNAPLPRLHVVTDDAVLAQAGVVEEAAAILAAGAEQLAFHIRGPHASGRRVYDLVTVLTPKAEAVGALLVVNDRVDVALAADIGAVHLGRRSLPVERVRALVGDDRMVGRSTHAATDVEEAAGAGADFVLFGNVRPTASHPERPGLGWGAVERAVASARGMPVIAIGGIEIGDVASALAAGAHGVAVLGGVWHAPDPPNAVRDYISALGRQR